MFYHFIFFENKTSEYINIYYFIRGSHQKKNSCVLELCYARFLERFEPSSSDIDIFSEVGRSRGRDADLDYYS